jgi:hypothetical protein
MTAAVAVVNLVLGVAYCGYGVMTIIEMRRDWNTFGFSHFGLAWIFMAFTCGPHHLFHGIHLAFEGRHGEDLDLLAVVVGLPVGVTWLVLRVEAFFGGRGDRFVPSTPRWLRAVPVGAVLYLAILGRGLFGVGRSHFEPFGQGLLSLTVAVANIALVGIYMAIGYVILRTQLANRPGIGGWSVSGLCLSMIFPTCALMHGVWAAYSLSGHFHFDEHGFFIDLASIPAALYFLWVVRGLYRDALSDWNEGPAEVVPERVEALV